jgi:hypothetical protein
MSLFFKRRPIIGLIILILIPFLVAYLLIFLCFFSSGAGGFVIPIQDCEMTKTTLQGTVVDMLGKSVADAKISYENTPVDRSTPVKRTLATDEKGHLGPESISFFKCEPINFTITANGFREKTASYILDYGLLNSLPGELNITLERSP